MKYEAILNAVKTKGLSFVYAYNQPTIRSDVYLTPKGTPLSPIACLLRLDQTEKEDVNEMEVDNFSFNGFGTLFNLTPIEVQSWCAVEDTPELPKDSPGGITVEEHARLRKELEKLTKGRKPRKKKAKTKPNI